MNKKLCNDCIEELSLYKNKEGDVYYLFDQCKIQDAIEYLRNKKDLHEDYNKMH